MRVHYILMNNIETSHTHRLLYVDGRIHKLNMNTQDQINFDIIHYEIRTNTPVFHQHSQDRAERPLLVDPSARRWYDHKDWLLPSLGLLLVLP